MSQGTAFHDTSSTGSPQYDFIARPKNMLPAGNPSFASIPVVPQTAVLAPGYVPERAPGLSRLQKRLVAVPLLAVTAALAAFVGSVALHAYRDHQRSAQIAATHIVLPRAIAGMTRHGGSAQTQVDKLITAVPTPTPPQGGAYVATKARTGLVFAGAYAMTDAEQRDYLESVRSSAAHLGFTLTRSDAGSLGGQMWCAASTRRHQTFCAFTDVAAYGVVLAPGVGADGLSTAGTFRTAVERRS